MYAPTSACTIMIIVKQLSTSHLSRLWTHFNPRGPIHGESDRHAIIHANECCSVSCFVRVGVFEHDQQIYMYRKQLPGGDLRGRCMAAGQRLYWYSNHESKEYKLDDWTTTSGRRCNGQLWVHGEYYGSLRSTCSVDSFAFDPVELSRT